ncbi:hypothetical protein QWJ34_20990 [Saccharibacillus sp. CPCC 101409]|uniref:hypothetical protein n=1 Tax=Saccharibacillus sp. CPCC 101409 TaxID=3058041 RepID=UPI002673B8E6|nr:hypothetical protein [Saccharibacillus sp. CPCC 101409]MDO3412253.1 hypothetical protein [Saccharibacillus sp. CPCC 101409]
MTDRNGRDSFKKIGREKPDGITFLSGCESADYGAAALEAIARRRPEIDPAELLPLSALKLGDEEVLLEYGRQHRGIPLYQEHRVFVRMDPDGGLRDLRANWPLCRFEEPPGEGFAKPAGMGGNRGASCLRGAYALEASSEAPLYLFPPRMVDRGGERVVRRAGLGPWEWLDLRAAAAARRNSREPRRAVRGGGSSGGEGSAAEPLDREEQRRVRAAVLAYLARRSRPRGFRWAFLAGREASSFRPVDGGCVHVRAYRLANGLPVLGGSLDLYVERGSGRLLSASDELSFRRSSPEGLAGTLLKPKLKEGEAWESLRDTIRAVPVYDARPSPEDRSGGAPRTASFVWLEESPFVYDAAAGRLIEARPIRL